MIKLLKKQWFVGLSIIATMIMVFFINFWIMSLELSWLYTSDNLLSISLNQYNNGFNYIFAFILMVFFYVTILPILFSGLIILRKKSKGLLIQAFVLLAFVISLIVFQSLTSYLPLLASILIIVNIVLLLCVFTLIILRIKQSKNVTKPKTKEVKTVHSHNTNIPLTTYFINIIAYAILITTFFIPIYTWVKPGPDYDAIMINVLFSGDSSVINLIYFLVNITVFIVISLYLVEIMSSYIFDKDKFISQSKKFIKSVFIITSLFFLVGLVVDISYAILYEETITSISYIPMALMFIVVFYNALLMGKYKTINQVIVKEKKKKFYHFEPLLYVFLLTAITVLMNFLAIIKFDIVSGGYSHFVNLTGFDILRDYASLEEGYRIAAYLLVVMFITVGFCLVVSITSYLSKSKRFYSIVKVSTIVNVFFVFIVGISGYYFQIARDINKAIVIDMADFYGVTITNTSALSYTVATDAIYGLIASIVILIIMFMRKAFDREEMSLLETAAIDNSNATVSKEIEEETIQDFDPCYSFTELDLKTEIYNKDLLERKKLIVKEPTLHALVQFVVDYAKNSRLHLSYTPEDIATFVAGLGASKLSILQGMSGTGKTSLPKIFSEAIYGNCDIIEVESSWKDKNELLGYYNEFSKIYTPKKFTLALYKARLNKEIFTFILLDEMNLSRIEYYFSDFFSLMESEENQRELKLVNINLSRKEEDKDIDYLCLENGHTLRIPENVWFIGTANRDESTFVISDKVYDRAHTMNFTKRAPKVRNYSDPIEKQYYDYKIMNDLFNNAKQNKSFDAEQSELIKSVEELLAPYNISFGNRILGQIEDFVTIYKGCFINEDVESEAVEKILLSKVVSKLEVKTIEDKEKLEVQFRKLNLLACAEFIKHLDED
ncbi:MAG: hypothetical protein JEZ05_00940 [Tenericutes bacterium]|nr:hypothetical protein [Mycoplasmatota bacterium]